MCFDQSSKSRSCCRFRPAIKPTGRLTCHRWIIETHALSSAYLLQTLKFQFSYRNRPARHRSNSKLISPTDPCRSTSSRHISIATARRPTTGRSYTGCWAERTFRKDHITGDTAPRVQVSSPSTQLSCPLPSQCLYASRRVKSFSADLIISCSFIRCRWKTLPFLWRCPR